MRDVKQQLTYLTKGCVDVISPEALEAKLERSLAGGPPLTVKVGFDPSAPDLHLGHTVLIRKMKHFQELGHRVVFLIGDFTGLIGDPTGRNATRPQLTVDEIQANARTYERQIYTLLDRDKTVIEFNSRWLGRLSSEDWIRLAAKVTVAQMLERDDFRRRYEGRRPIALHEFMYPLAQAYDSVTLECDVELGGTDQLFNLLLGRDIMRESELEPQVVMTVPLLEGLDGVEKMSKSLGNHVALEDPPNDMFGKLMSLSDKMMWPYWLLLTDRSEEDIDALRDAVSSGGRHPMDVKRELARTITTEYHGREAAREAGAEFDRVFSQRQRPTDMPEVELPGEAAVSLLSKVLADAELVESNSEARRMIKQGAVRVDDERVSDVRAELPTAVGTSYVIRVGKRRFAVVRFV